MGIPDNKDKHHQTWERRTMGKERSHGRMKVSEWKTRREIQRVNAREVQKLIAENCQGKRYYSSFLSVQSRL